MIIDLKKLRNSGKSQEDFYFEYVPEGISNIPNVTVSQINANGTVYLEGDHSAFIEGEVNFSLNGDCTRCLENATREYLATFSENADNNDENAYPVMNDKIDLKKIVEDCVIMNLPISFLCDENCKGLCPKCGANLNKSACKCEK